MSYSAAAESGFKKILDTYEKYGDVLHLFSITDSNRKNSKDRDKHTILTNRMLLSKI